MKKAGIILMFVAMFLPARGQNPLLDLPFFPTRDTNHIHEIRTYTIDTMTRERKLKCTEHYDRHGYCSDSTYRNVYDNRGRLILQETYQWVSSTGNTKPRREVLSRCSIDYAADGTVQHVNTESFGKYYEGESNYYLNMQNVHPRFGLMECVYLSKWKQSVDTIRFLREYDSVGRLLRDYCNVENLSGYRDAEYFYDASGRLTACRNYYYESWDTLDYNYAPDGTLISQTGKMYDLDMEADVTITYRPDGTRQERREHWVVYSNPDDISDEYMRYDQRGVLVYWKSPAGITEYEIEYWE